MKHDLHIANIERELEVIKWSLHKLITEDAIFARNHGHLDIAAKLLEVRSDLDSIFPNPCRCHKQEAVK